MILLETGKARRMLISGVNSKVTRAQIGALAPLRRAGAAGRRFYDCCVDLGFQATDTLGNARWRPPGLGPAQGLRLIDRRGHLRLPHAPGDAGAEGRHARRVLADALSGPVWRNSRSPGIGGGPPGSARLLAVEYCKYLAIEAREALLSLGPKHANNAAPVASGARP